MKSNESYGSNGKSMKTHDKPVTLAKTKGNHWNKKTKDNEKSFADMCSITLVFISHDLPVIRQMCDRVAVMRNGMICELENSDKLFESPKHPYSKHLLDLMPTILNTK